MSPEILQAWDSRLTAKNQDIDFSKDLEYVKITLLPKLHRIMEDKNCVGFAAPQINEHFNVFITEIRQTQYRTDPNIIDKLRFFINPEIIYYSSNQNIITEGCASVQKSQLSYQIARPQEIVIATFDENGHKFKLSCNGLLARVIQHEYDHLKGKLFTSYPKALEIDHDQEIKNSQITKRTML